MLHAACTQYHHTLSHKLCPKWICQVQDHDCTTALCLEMRWCWRCGWWVSVTSRSSWINVWQFVCTDPLTATTALKARYLSFWTLSLAALPGPSVMRDFTALQTLAMSCLNQCWAVLDSYEETLVLVPVLISKNRIGSGSDFGTGTRFSVFSMNGNQTGIRILVF